MNPTRQSFLALALSILVLHLGGCQDRSRAPAPVFDPSGNQPDLGVVVDASFDEPVRDLCVPGSRRCVAENSPMFERCSDTGTSYVADTCEDGEVCREGDCVAFACVPDRPLCVGATTRAVCDDSGKAVRDATPCEGSQECLGGACIDPCEQAEAAGSYITCEYVAHDVPNLYQELQQSRDAPFGIVVANPARLLPATVNVSNGGTAAGLRERFTLEPSNAYALGKATVLESQLLLSDGSTEPIDTSKDVVVPAGAAAVFLMRDNGPYRVQSDRPVVAYQFSPYCCNFTATNDASLLLPVSAWGSSYRAISYPAWRLSENAQYEHGYVTLLSTEARTVTVEAPVPVKDVMGFEASTSLEVTVLPNSPVILETTDPDDDSAPDISGIKLTGDGPFGVIVGHPCTFVPQDKWACDHLEEFLLPDDILGERYILTPVRRRNTSASATDISEATYWRIGADEDAEVTFSPALEDLRVLPPSAADTDDCRDLIADGVVVLDAGTICEFGTRDATAIVSTGKLLVAGIISGHQSTGVNFYGTQAGDPALFFLPPVEQFRSDYAFVNPPTFKRTYVTAAAPPGAAVTLNGRAIPEDQRLERRSVDIGRESWEIFTVALEPGLHQMASDSRFGIVVYAYDDYVSYAFTGGLDLLPKGAGE